MEPPSVQVVVCAYDEADSIAELIERIGSAARGDGWRCRVLVVDDGSTDATAALAKKAGREFGVEVAVEMHQVNRGLGAALQTGLSSALGRAGAGEVIVTMDADLTHDPGDIAALLSAIAEGADVAIASRAVDGSRVEGVPGYRRLLTTAARLLIGLVAPIPGVRDCTSGFRAYRAAVLAGAAERSGGTLVAESGFGCQLELLLRLRGEARFAEVPFTLHYGRKRRASALRAGPAIRSYLRVLAASARSR